MTSRLPISVVSAAASVAACLACAAPASAAFVKITGTASDANSATLSSGIVTGLKLNSVSYTPSQFVHITVDDFNGTGTSATLLYNTGNTSTTTDFNPTESFRRNLIESDNRIDTGVINLGTGTSAFVASFAAPVANIPGADMVFMEIGTSSNGPDPFAITINGVTLTATGGTNSGTVSYGNTGATSGDAGAAPETLHVRNINNDGHLNNPTLSELLTRTLRIGTTNVTQSVYAIGIDFSDFGILPGATVSSFTMRSTDSGNQVDPVFIVGVPEPTSAAALGLVASALLLHRRRRSGI